MKPKRLFQTLKLMLISESSERAKYLKEKKIFASVGEGCSYMNRTVPLYPELIKLGDNVHLASNVSFLTHDISFLVLNNLCGEKKFKERIGCIEICDNTFVGAGVRIMYDTRIGKNCIIASGSVVTHDIPDNCVAGGVPAKVICSIDDYIEKYNSKAAYPEELRPRRQTVSPELADWMWTDFEARHKTGL